MKLFFPDLSLQDLPNKNMLLQSLPPKSNVKMEWQMCTRFFVLHESFQAAAPCTGS